MGIAFGGKRTKPSKEERERIFEAEVESQAQIVLAWRSVHTHVPEINHAIEYGEFYPQNLTWRIDDMILHLNQMKKYLFGIKPRK